MRNEAMTRLEGLVGEWTMTLTNAWFLDRMDIEVPGKATISWLGDAFLELRGSVGTDQGTWQWVIGRSDANDQYVLLYQDDRAVLRVFDMTFDAGEWVLLRADPDFHQRFIATVGPDRIDGRWEASEDGGATWRKDFDLIFARLGAGGRA